jgi:hypothetical protein
MKKGRPRKVNFKAAGIRVVYRIVLGIVVTIEALWISDTHATAVSIRTRPTTGQAFVLSKPRMIQA